MTETQEIYLKVYTAAIQGWLTNKYAAEGSPESTADHAHKLADILATNAVEALDDYAEDAE